MMIPFCTGAWVGGVANGAHGDERGGFADDVGGIILSGNVAWCG